MRKYKMLLLKFDTDNAFYKLTDSEVDILISGLDRLFTTNLVKDKLIMAIECVDPNKESDILLTIDDIVSSAANLIYPKSKRYSDNHPFETPHMIDVTEYYKYEATADNAVVSRVTEMSAQNSPVDIILIYYIEEYAIHVSQLSTHFSEGWIPDENNDEDYIIKFDYILPDDKYRLFLLQMQFDQEVIPSYNIYLMKEIIDGMFTDHNTLQVLMDPIKRLNVNDVVYVLNHQFHKVFDVMYPKEAQIKDGLYACPKPKFVDVTKHYDYTIHGDAFKRVNEADVVLNTDDESLRSVNFIMVVSIDEDKIVSRIERISTSFVYGYFLNNTDENTNLNFVNRFPLTSYSYT